MLCTGCGSCKRQTESNIAVQNLQNLQFLCCFVISTANSAQNSASAEAQNLTYSVFSEANYTNKVMFEYYFCCCIRTRHDHLCSHRLLL